MYFPGVYARRHWARSSAYGNFVYVYLAARCARYLYLIARPRPYLYLYLVVDRTRMCARRVC